MKQLIFKLRDLNTGKDIPGGRGLLPADAATLPAKPLHDYCMDRLYQILSPHYRTGFVSLVLCDNHFELTEDIKMQDRDGLTNRTRRRVVAATYQIA